MKITLLMENNSLFGTHLHDGSHHTGRARALWIVQHHGICKENYQDTEINTNLGGSYLRIDKVEQSQEDITSEYVRSQKIENLYVCHDTDLHCKLALWNATPSKEAYVGLIVECN